MVKDPLARRFKKYMLLSDRASGQVFQPPLFGPKYISDSKVRKGTTVLGLNVSTTWDKADIESYPRHNKNYERPSSQGGS